MVEEKIMFVDFYNSFINTYSKHNNIQFSINSYCCIVDGDTGKERNFYHASCMKSENTYGIKKLFKKPFYDFTVIFGNKVFKFIRSGIYEENTVDNYSTCRDTPPGRNKYKKSIKKVLVYSLETYDLFADYMGKGKRLFGRTIIKDRNNKAVIYYPIKCINYSGKKKMWQVDTGPILYPVLSKMKNSERSWIENIKLSYIAFNSIINKTYFLIEKPIKISDKYICYYDEIMEVGSKNDLFGIRGE